MEFFFSFALVAITLTFPGVLGGNQAWETSIKLGGVQSPLDPALPVDNTTVIADLHRAKRALSIVPGSGNADRHIWPNMNIPYCFEHKSWPDRGGKSTKEILFNDLVEARDLWYQQGLPESFKWTELNDYACSSSQRSDYLLIQFNTEGRLSSTVGKPPIDSLNPGPRMLLSDSVEVGMLNVVANYAHEMGHVWGLYHEHQNQAYWGSPYSASGGSVFGMNNFHCENLNDYEATVARVTNAYPAWQVGNIVRDFCRFRANAEDVRFSASDYLPWVNTQVLADSNTNVDWDSIMIYPSGAGGKGSASPGNDQRMAVLTKPNGDLIPINLKPSARDIAALKKLYSYKSSVVLNFLGSSKNKLKQTFDKIRKKDPDNICNVSTTTMPMTTPTTTPQTTRHI
ncbi:hypothetical protein MferCBS49748_000800 [Microsporum ferrugineum]